MRNLSRTAFVAILCALVPSAWAQQNHAADRLIAARALYYTPTTSGLKTFHCSVSMDWKDLLTRFSGKEIASDNPFLLYLNSVQMSTTDDLNGKGTLEWVTTSAPSDDLSGPVTQMRDGVSQTLGGFYQAWNEFMNGGMVPAPDATTIVSPAADGFKLRATSDTYVVDEVFDKNSLLTDVHVTSKDMDVAMVPTYADSPNGRIISSLQYSARQPPSAPPTDMTMSMTYANVSSFQLPASLHVDIKNVGAFVFNFSACTVQTSNAAPNKP